MINPKPTPEETLTLDLGTDVPVLIDAKKADAALRISLARRNSRTSRSKSAMCCCSTVVTPGR
jgi:hypothetical protein